MKFAHNLTKLFKYPTAGIIISSAVLSAGISQADDTEIYTSGVSVGVKPNLIFLFDTSGSMGYSAVGKDGVPGTRLSVSQDAAISIISGISDINISLMQFDNVESGQYPLPVTMYPTKEDYDAANDGDWRTGYETNRRNNGGFVLVPMGDVNDPDQKSAMISSIQGLQANAYTPLHEAYDEAGRYLRGDDVKYGKKYGNVSCSVEENTVTVDGYYEDVKQCQVCNVPGYSTNDYRISPSRCYIDERYWVQTGRWWWQGEYRTQRVNGTLSTVSNSQCTDWSQNPGWVVTGENWVEGYTYTETVKDCETTPSAQYFYVSDPRSYDATTGKYNSPIVNSCQSNNIVVFTDGVSSQDGASDERTHDLLNSLTDTSWMGLPGMSSNCSTTGSSDSCLEEMAYYLAHADNIPDSELQVDDNLNSESIQSITTYTVGGFLDSGSSQAIPRLQRMAEYSGGKYYEATDYDSLKEQLSSIFEEVAESAYIGTSAPAVAVNALNRLESSEELYYSVYEPNVKAAWPGNLKRYKLGNDGRVKGKDDEDAVDDATGYFSESAISFWTDSDVAPDGKDVAVGGIASQLTHDRKVFTYLGSGSGPIDDPLVSVVGNEIDVADGINQDLFGTELGEGEFLNMLTWAAGIQKNTDGEIVARQQIEDPLHSQPVIINYYDDEEDRHWSSIFFGTNAGYLHAFDTDVDSPREHFSYVPAGLLSNIAAYYENADQLGKTYGIDGPISSFIFNDEDRTETGDTIIKPRSVVGPNDKAYLYFGLRRGGNSYYALDVTDPDNPKHLWEIHGETTGYERLGQSWSEMVPVFVNPKAIGIDSDLDRIPVLIFGGGYDTNEDEKRDSVRLDHDKGNAIYIVDALTGQLLWSVSPDSYIANSNEMTSPITNRITPVDNDGDGDVDILYASDVGGRIWRVDLYSNGTQDLTMLADLNARDVTGNARFYTSPTVSYMSGIPSGQGGDRGAYVVSLGSGYRAHPLSTQNQDSFFVLFDYASEDNEEVNADMLNSYSTKYVWNLANYSNFAGASTEMRENGFYYQLPDTGEKVLSDAIVANNTIFFTSYKPIINTMQAGTCYAATGNAFLYAADISDYDPTSSNPGVLLERTELAQSGIPAAPVIVYTSEPADPDDGNNGGVDDGEDGGTGSGDDGSDTGEDGSEGSGSGSGDTGDNGDGESGGDCVGTTTTSILIGSESITKDKCLTAQKEYWHEL